MRSALASLPWCHGLPAPGCPRWSFGQSADRANIGLVLTRPTETTDIECPRCGASSSEVFYGPCTSCREQLRAEQGNEQREAELEAYEPKMNVVPNQVATKD
jgi:ribosomal protein L37E